MAEAAFSGQHRVVVDWDGTCVPLRWPDHPEEWLPGAKEALESFLAAGLDVLILSTRLLPYNFDDRTPIAAPDWLREYNYIRDMLDAAGLEAVGIWTKIGKPGGLFYVDDKGVKFDGDWNAIVKEVCP